ncbi:MAG: guanine deaminase [Pseudomonadota bacterium]
MSDPMADCTVRGDIVHFIDSPTREDPKRGLVYIPNGLLKIRDGRVIDVAPFDQEVASEETVIDYSGHLIMPGFIDAHVHYVQADVIASYGKQLLDWLNDYTFPLERRYSDPELCRETAQWFLRELWRNGTTTALVWPASFKQSAAAIFESAYGANMRLISGKVMMDRHCPDYLADSARSSYEDSLELIQQWHGKGRLSYAVTPRFAPTSTEEQLNLAGRLMADVPDVYMQTHLAENQDEIRWVKELFPKSRSYLDVYRQFGLLSSRSFFGHCIYLDDEDRKIMSRRNATAVFCPTSNLFLGSGLFDLRQAEQVGLSVALGSDVGGGSSYGMLQTMHGAYSITQLKGFPVFPLQPWHWATLGAAKALNLEDSIGNFEPGKEADFVVIDPKATEVLSRRMASSETLEEKLFALMVLGDDRAIKATYILGVPKHSV